MFEDEPTESGMPDVSDSLVSGGWEAITSAAEAVGDVAEAGLDFAAAGSDAILGGVAHVGAGLMDAVGAEETAAEIRWGADEMQNAASYMVDQGVQKLGEAKDDIF